MNKCDFALQTVQTLIKCRIVRHAIWFSLFANFKVSVYVTGTQNANGYT